MKWYIEIQVNGGHVGMPVSPWCKILTEKGDGRLVCESLGDPEKIWVIDPNEITGGQTDRGDPNPLQHWKRHEAI